MKCEISPEKSRLIQRHADLSKDGFIKCLYEEKPYPNYCIREYIADYNRDEVVPHPKGLSNDLAMASDYGYLVCRTLISIPLDNPVEIQSNVLGFESQTYLKLNEVVECGYKASLREWIERAEALKVKTLEERERVSNVPDSDNHVSEERVKSIVDEVVKRLQSEKKLFNDRLGSGANK